MDPEPYLIACHPEYKEEFLALISDKKRGMQGMFAQRVRDEVESPLVGAAPW